MESNVLSLDHLLRQNKTTHGKTNRDWWPNQLRLNILHQNSLESIQWTNFNYAEEFKK
jgi:catalase-peroxidase